MLNYEHKNLKSVLTAATGEQTLIIRNPNTIETIIVGGQVCNKDPDLVALFNMIMYNIETEDSTYLYKNIKIPPKDYLSLTKLSLNENQSIITSVSFEDSNEVSEINITLNYFEVYVYE